MLKAIRRCSAATARCSQLETPERPQAVDVSELHNCLSNMGALTSNLLALSICYPRADKNSNLGCFVRLHGRYVRNRGANSSPSSQRRHLFPFADLDLAHAIATSLGNLTMKLNEHRLRSRLLKLSLALALGVVASSVNALPLLVTPSSGTVSNTADTSYRPAGENNFVPVPGQTVSYLSAVVQSGTSNTTFLQGIAACGISQSGCTQGPGSVHVLSPNTAVPALYGLNETLILNGGDNLDSADFVLAGSTAGLPATGITTDVLAEANDLQQLQINYNGPLPAPATIGVDISYSLSSEIQDLYDIEPNPFLYSLGADASVSVLDPATYDPTGGALPFEGSIQEVFGAWADNGAVLNQTSILSLTPDKPYWVEQDTGVSFFGLEPMLNGDAFIYNLSALADPTFSIDPTWLVQNPEYAGDITISQQFNSGTPVPEPETWLLFAAVLPGLLCAARLRKRAAIN